MGCLIRLIYYDHVETVDSSEGVYLGRVLTVDQSFMFTEVPYIYGGKLVRFLLLLSTHQGVSNEFGIRLSSHTRYDA